MNVKRLKKKKIVYRLQRNLAIDTQNIKVTKVVVKKKKKSGVSPVFIPLLPLAALHCCSCCKVSVVSNNPDKICRVTSFTLKPKWFARIHALTKAYTRR